MRLDDIRIVTDNRRMIEAKDWSCQGIQDESRIHELMPVLRRLIRPKGAFTYQKEGKKGRMYVVMTLGPTIERYIDTLQKRHEYADAVALSAMADEALFSFEKIVQTALKQYCIECHVGISCRIEELEGPKPLTLVACHAVDAQRTLGVSLTESHMMMPEKSMALAFDVTDDMTLFCVQHTCASCRRQQCQFRSVSGRRVTCPGGVVIATYLQDQGIPLPYICGGKGICGACRIKVIEGHLSIHDADKAIFSDAELHEGWRLACCSITDDDVTILVPQVESESMQSVRVKGQRASYRDTMNLGVAIDIGSTTIAAALVDTISKQVLSSSSAVNRQRMFGADVVSRIKAANEGHEKELHDLVIESIEECMQALLEPSSIRPDVIESIVVAGNTTMEHLFMGWSCQGLGEYPFHPVSLGGETVQARCAFGKDSPYGRASLYLIPGISTYVGGDIVAGIAFSGMDKQDDISLLLDLGTNGEMALGNRHGIVVASTAAGPALEGGQISCGMSSVRGAICGVSVKGDEFHVSTIGNVPPKGLCGSGVIEAMAALIEKNIVEKTGTLRPAWFDTGVTLAKKVDGTPIVLTQGDIREIQMAKGAIRAGIDTLLMQNGLSEKDVKHFYLAGGFGHYLNQNAAATMGLLVSEWIPITTVLGNSSLEGAVSILTNANGIDTIKQIAESAQTIVLGNDPSFEEAYISHLNFM